MGRGAELGLYPMQEIINALHSMDNTASSMCVSFTTPRLYERILIIKVVALGINKLYGLFPLCVQLSLETPGIGETIS